MNLLFTRPIVFFDLETTGTDFVQDRVVQIAVLKLFTDLTEEVRTRLVNPGVSIPKGASEIHGIYDDDVKDKPRFAEIAKSLSEFFEDCDLAGYNSNNFDIPFLVEEFARCGIEFPSSEAKLIDVCTIFKKKEERTLSAAMKFYCDKSHDDAHDAEADVRATLDVFKAQLARYKDIGATAAELHDFCSRGEIVDYARKLAKNEEGEIVFNFGKNKGKAVRKDLDYARWMLESDFPEGTKNVLRRIVDQSQPNPASR
jgi:DNA polymerase-3 subunit epsilon